MAVDIYELIDQLPDRHLAHYGVPGMKWGKNQKKDDTPKNLNAQQKALYESSQVMRDTYKKYGHLNLNKLPMSVQEDIASKIVAENLKKGGSSKSEIDRNVKQFKADVNKAKTSSTKTKTKRRGSKMQLVHSDELMHHGIKGMKWGVRRSEAQLARAQEGIRRANEHEPDKVYTSGKGRRTRVQSGEAARAAGLNAVAKKHGPSTLSNKDLEFLNKRLQLQTTYTKLSPKEKSKIATIINGARKLDRMADGAISGAAKNAAVKIIDSKTNGKASQIQKVLDETVAKQRPKTKSSETSKSEEPKAGEKSVIETVKSRPREIYNAETGSWETIER